MDQDQLRTLLEQVRAGAVDVDAAIERMRHLPFEDLGFAKVDHHRALRHGIPEVVFAQGKTAAQVSAIVAALLRNAPNVLVTRAFHVWMIDFTRAFRPWPVLRSTEGLLRCEREVYAKLRSMTLAELKAAAEDVLEPHEIEGVLARRDLLIAHYEKLVRQRGESAVLY